MGHRRAPPACGTCHGMKEWHAACHHPMRQHPFVRAWLRAEAFDTVDLVHHLDPSNPRDAALAATIRALWGEGDAQAILRGTVLVIDASDEFALLARLFQAMLAVRRGAAQSAQALLRGIEPLLGASPPGFRAYACSVRGMLLGATGDSVGHLRWLRRAVDVLPSDDPRWAVQALPLAVALARQGRLKAFGKGLDRLATVPTGKTLPGIAFLDLCDAAERGDWTAAAAAWTVVQTDLRKLPAVHPQLKVTLASYGAVVAMISGQPGDTDQPACRSLHALWTGDAAGALHWARQAPEELTRGAGLLHAALVRAELANRNAAAALRLLELRRSRGCRSLAEDHLWGQARWLLGDGALAEALIQKAADEAGNAAAGRIALEWDLAIGLGRSAVATLARRPARPAAVPAATPPPEAGAHVLIGRSPAMTAVRRAIARFAGETAPVLITGETGTGKELAARLLHAGSPRSKHPFIAVNAAALGETLIESELFGHERGSFSGAVAAHAGWFEQAGEGTLFLDEIGDTPPRLQAALLRVLETGEFRRVGGDRTRHARCRLLAATNRDLAAEAAAGRFRDDLRFRLQRLSIHLPALRERPEDIPDIARHLLGQDSRDPEAVTITPALATTLRRRPWPGNVRQLRNELETMRILASERGHYDAGDLAQGSAQGAPRRDAATRRQSLAALFAQHGRLRRSEVMRHLGISQQTATADLRALIAAKTIVKRTPNPAPRSHYFERL
jgi:DNA-binding NtrC family response regulator